MKMKKNTLGPQNVSSASENIPTKIDDYAKDGGPEVV